MRVRSFGLLILTAVSIAPLAVFAYLAVSRSSQAAVAEVKTGNERLALSIADRIATYADVERSILNTIGTAILSAPTQAQAEDLTIVFRIEHPHIRDLGVYRADGAAVIEPGGGFNAKDRDLAKRGGLAGNEVNAPVRPAAANEQGGFAHTMTVGVPIRIVGKQEGALVARLDLVDIWKPVNATRVGRRGFVRLLTADGTLLAHGDPEERRYVFAGQEDPGLIQRMGTVYRNRAGVEVVAAGAPVRGRDWFVIIEQPVAEAFGTARALKQDLFWLGGATLVLAVSLGFLLGGRVVRSLERLRAHTLVLAAGDLDARVDARAPVTELSALAASVNDMAASIQKLHREAQARERLNTFASVAAGLAHDLRVPIETIRTACHELDRAPDDPRKRELFRWMLANDLPRLKRFVEDLRRLAVEGNLGLEQREFGPDQLVADIVSDLRSSQRWPGVEFTSSGAAHPVVGDRDLVRRAVYNLAANGADACAKQGPGGRVEISVAESAHPDALLLSVVDSGVGVDPDELAKIMQNDFRSTKRDSGIGLGLGVARRIAAAHGGRIEAESIPGAGSRFTLWLPRHHRQADSHDASSTNPT